MRAAVEAADDEVSVYDVPELYGEVVEEAWLMGRFRRGSGRWERRIWIDYWRVHRAETTTWWLGVQN